MNYSAKLRDQSTDLCGLGATNTPALTVSRHLDAFSQLDSLPNFCFLFTRGHLNTAGYPRNSRSKRKNSRRRQRVKRLMAVCQFFLRGQCKFGDNCRNVHPAENQRQGGFGNQSWTASNASQNAGDQIVALFSADSISKDVTPQVDKPLWPLSSYGPAKYEPNLVTNLDVSFEELRARAVTALKNNTMNDYYKYETDKISASDQTYANARSNVSQAYDRAVQQSNATKPTPAGSAFGGPVNTATAGTSSFGGGTSGSAFGGGSSTTTSAFGQPSAFGGGSTGSVFGSTSTPTTTSAFGKSTFGQPAFGQSAFGKTPTPTTTSAFGQPGQSTSAFGNTTTPASTSAFGQPQQTISAFGQASMPQSSLIKPATGAFGSTGTGTGGGFGAFGGEGGSGQSAFAGGTSGTDGGFSAFAGQPSAFGLGAAASTNTTLQAPASGGSVFGQSAFGNPPAAPSAFGKQEQGSAPAFGATSAFGALSQPPNTGGSVFGTSALSSTTNNSGSAFGSGGAASVSAFSSNTTSSSPFAPQSQGQSTSPFAPAPPTSAFAAPAPPTSAFAAPAPPTSAFSAPAAPRSAFATPTPSSQSAFSSQPSAPPPSKPQPGPPDFANAKSSYKPGLDKYDDLLPANYLQLLPNAVREAFQSSKFEWGNVPEWVPPKELR